jgi:hypothetical protein
MHSLGSPMFTEGSARPVSVLRGLSICVSRLPNHGKPFPNAWRHTCKHMYEPNMYAQMYHGALGLDSQPLLVWPKKGHVHEVAVRGPSRDVCAPAPGSTHIQNWPVGLVHV